MNLYAFNWDCGRMGELDGLFIATEEEVNKAIGKHLYFGEVLGKHSDIEGTLEASEITKLDVSQQTINELFKVIGGTISGFNPLEYLPEEDDDE